MKNKKKNNKTLKTIGERLKKARENSGMSVYEVAKKTGMNASYIERIEAGNAIRLNISQTEILSESLNTDLYEIIKGLP